MNVEDLKLVVKEIVTQACELKNKHTEEVNASVNYACVFSQSAQEYDNLLKNAQKMGEVIKKTPTGPVFHIHPLDTISGELRLLKIRSLDVTRPERGDADFTVSNYPNFKKKYLPKNGFKLIKREDFEMIELIDSEFNVRVYFSDPTLEKQLGIV